ncbi:adenylate/guanylate cyclase domain-containing protein, partial [Mycobacterium tuberculosis]
ISATIRTARSRSSGGYLLDEPPDMTPSFPRTGVSGHAGAVQSSVVYDMWGAAVSLAYQMHSGSPQPGIYVTSQVYEAMRDVWQFTAAGTISVGGLEEPIYRLSERS